MARSTSTSEREARERLRRYQARQTLHESRTARRVRDNIGAVIALVVVAAVATIGQIVYFSAGPGAPEPVASASPSPSSGASDEAEGAQPPSPEVSEFREWSGTMTINESIPLELTLDGMAAPQAVASFVQLTQDGFYDGLTCHRLTTSGIFVLQCGDPVGDGTGGPDYRYGPIENAPADDVYPAGTLAMARQGGDGASMGSQFFIVYEESTIPSDAAGGYTVLGEITGGLEALIDEVVAGGVEGGATDGRPATAATITSITIE
ncbi:MULTISPECIES: peptidylprolyl isomerase [unclassified Microcella]|uniref:peptidylprolyl isomerase n=1 Tax=unclassified Microcella TaxID=2630066 RepID=UPI0006F51211|nr:MULTISPECIES: peptidylprolyl isomerase [unclassified Microcella]KQV24982.1 peptidylprolyl isomerase [Yonghaparkia sp. Root332]KRF31267.1 peptidylprolyl isomerase [Yonghaparkia sp. Soil809]